MDVYIVKLRTLEGDDNVQVLCDEVIKVYNNPESARIFAQSMNVMLDKGHCFVDQMEVCD